MDPTDTDNDNDKECYRSSRFPREEHDDGEEEEELVSDDEEEELDLLLPIPPHSPTGHGRGGGGAGGGNYSGHETPLHTPTVPTACAEHAVLRVSLILHESTRRFDSRVRTAARGLAKGLRLRKRRARHLLARSALLVLDHGLANGSLDGLRGRFPAPRPQPRRDDNGEQCFGTTAGLGSPAMSVSSEDEHEHRDSFSNGGGGGGDGGLASTRALPPRSGLPRSVAGFDEMEGVDGKGGGYGHYSSRQIRAEGGGGGGGGGGGCEDPRGGWGVGVTRRLGRDALQYAGAVHFLTGVSAVCLLEYRLLFLYSNKIRAMCCNLAVTR